VRTEERLVAERDGRSAPIAAESPPGGEPAAPDLPRRSRRRLAVTLLGLVVFGLVAFAVWRLFLAPPALPPGVIAASGRIEGDDAAVAAKTSGRIREITVREGDRVNAGQMIAFLDDEQVRAREQQAEAALRQAEARVRLAQHQISVLNEQVRQNELGVEQARVDAQGRVGEAEARVAAAEAQLAQAEASYAQAKWDRDAYTRLRDSGAVAEQEARRAQSAERTQAHVVAAARRQLDAARGVLTAARANLVNPSIRSSQLAAVQGQILQAQADIAAAQADAERARAQLEEARANRNDLRVIAPFAGTVATRTAEPGEVVTAGTPIITLLDLAQVYLRAFVAEGSIGRVRVGQPGRVYLDSDPATPIEAYVSRVDPEASFTPENTYFREDRVKQVVGVKLQLRGAVGFAKPGMPADGEILVEGGEWPVRRVRR
jgi:HlyD family secretion protein